MTNIAKNIKSIKDTKQNLKTEIRKRGGEITDNTPFKEYPSFIKTIGIEYKPLGTVKNSYTGTISEKTRSDNVAKETYSASFKDNIGTIEWLECGNLTKNGNDYSGFSFDNYLKYVLKESIGTTEACTIYLSITTGELQIDEYVEKNNMIPLCGWTDLQNSNSPRGSFGIWKNQWYIYNNQSSANIAKGGNVLANYRYWLKVVFDTDGNVDLYVDSSDGNGYQLQISINSTVRNAQTLVLCGGYRKDYSVSKFFNGILHHAETEIIFD